MKRKLMDSISRRDVEDFLKRHIKLTEKKITMLKNQTKPTNNNNNKKKQSKIVLNGTNRT